MARRDREGKKVKDAIDSLDQFLTLVKNEYEMFFMGIVSKPPVHKVRNLKKMLRELEEQQLRNTAMRFQIRRLRAKFNTYNQLWMRSIKQIEAGTYKRHRFMADSREKLRKKLDDAKKKEQEARRSIKALMDGGEDSAPPERPSMDIGERPARRPERRPRPPAHRGHAIGSADLIKEYTAVRRSVGVRGDLDSKALERVLRKHAEAIKRKTGAREVRFRVVAENGKPKVKAIPLK